MKRIVVSAIVFCSCALFASALYAQTAQQLNDMMGNSIKIAEKKRAERESQMQISAIESMVLENVKDEIKPKYPPQKASLDLAEKVLRIAFPQDKTSIDVSSVKYSYLPEMEIGDQTVLPLFVQGKRSDAVPSRLSIASPFSVVCYVDRNSSIKSLFVTGQPDIDDGGSYAATVYCDKYFASILKKKQIIEGRIEERMKEQEKRVEEQAREMVLGYRTWTLNGKPLEAKITGIIDQTAILEDVDGKRRTGLIAKFSKEDVDVMKKFVKMYPEKNKQSGKK